MEYGYLIIAVLVGMYIGWSIHERFMINVIKENPEIFEAACKSAREDLEVEEITLKTDDGQSIRASGIELAIEQVKGVMYAYSKSDNKFIAQGETLEDLLQSAHTRFPGKTFFGDLPE